MYARDDSINWLLAKRANANLFGGPLNQSCVHLASARRSGQAAQIVRILLNSSAAEVRYKEDKYGTIPLFCGIEATNNNVCKELLNKDAEIQVGTEELIKLPNWITVSHILLKLKVVKQPIGDNALHLAARKKDHNLVKTLIEAGGQVDTQNNEGQTVLHLACILGDEDTVRVLFMARASPSITDLEDRVPIHLAAERGYSK